MTMMTRRDILQGGLLLGSASFCPLALGGMASAAAAQSGPDPASAAAMIAALAARSDIRRYDWPQRGRAPLGYVKGMAVAFGRAYCKLKAGDPAAIEMAKAETSDGRTDALAWYAPEYRSLGMSNAAAGRDTLRHAFVLLTGLGMRESSGQLCEGRDMSATNTTGETAEAGLFQVSYNSRGASPILPTLLLRYAGSTDFAAIFAEGVRCRPSMLRNWGSGPGVEFQRLTKACPAFAVEYSAVALRNMRSHWGPLNTKRAELRPECDALFQAVAALIEREGIVTV